MFLIFSGLGSASTGIEWHVLSVLVSGSECLWTLVRLEGLSEKITLPSGGYGLRSVDIVSWKFFFGGFTSNCFGGHICLLQIWCRVGFHVVS